MHSIPLSNSTKYRKNPGDCQVVRYNKFLVALLQPESGELRNLSAQSLNFVVVLIMLGNVGEHPLMFLLIKWKVIS